MKTAITLLAALALSALVLLGLWQLLPSSAPPTGGGPGEPRAGTAAEAPLQAATKEPGADQRSARAGEATPDEEADEASAEETWAAADSVWLRGTVSLRGACSGDEELVAYASAEPLELRQLDRLLAREAGAAPEGSVAKLLSRRPVGADGGFELPLPPGTEEAHVLVLGRYGHMERSRPLRLDELQPPVLSLVCGAALAGRVELPGGAEPTPGEVELALRAKVQGALSRDMGYARDVATAPDGSFLVRGLRPGRELTLDAASARFAAQRAEVAPLVAGATGHVRLLLTPGATLRGRVVDADGAPVADARVSAARKVMLLPDLGEREATTDAEGRFTLAAMPPGPLSLQARCDGYRESEPELVEVVEGQELAGLELTVDRGAAVTGTLRWRGGEPAAGVEVRAELDPAQRFRMGGLAALRGDAGTAKTDADGDFRITGLGASRFDLRASAEPDEARLERLGATELGAAGEWVASASSVKADGPPVQLVLEPPRGVAGVVLDETGAPVREFELRAVLVVETTLGDLARDRREERFEDDEGRFHLKGLVPGRWNLYVIAEGFSAADPTEVLVPEQEEEPLELRVARAASVSGTVLTPRGAPVFGARVSVDIGGPFWTLEISGAPTAPSATTAEDGSFTLADLTPGSVTLIAEAEGHARAVSDALELAPGEELRSIDLMLREGGTILGVVHSKEQERSSSRMVQAVRMSDLATHVGRSDERGEFRFEHVEAGTWQVQALPGESVLAGFGGTEDEDMGDLISEIRSAVVEVLEGETVEVELGRPPADPIELRGRVLAGGAPRPKAMVSFYSEGKDMLQKMRNTTTDAEGRFSMTLDGPGKYVAAVQSFGEQFTQHSSCEFQVEIPAGPEHELELALPEGRISGHLRAVGGGKVAGERVTLYAAGPVPTGSLWGGGYSEIESDEDGAFDLTGLRPGRYAVAVGGMSYGGMFDRSAEYGRQVREVNVREGEWVQDVDFRLEPAARARVVVVDAAGKPVPGAAVFVRDEGGHLVELFSATSTDSRGVCEYGGLAPGRYGFSARKDGFASEESRPIQVGGEEPTEVRLALEEGTLLWVKLLDGEGNGVQASLSVLDSEGREVGAMVALDDIFEILGGAGFSMTERRIGPLPPGEYLVVATRPDGRSESKPVNLRKRSERRLSIYFRD